MPCWPLLLLTLVLLTLPGVLPSSGRGDLAEIRGPLRWLYWAFQAYAGLWHGLRTEGYAPLPVTGPAILIANHTCGIDHMLLQASSRRLLGFMVAREYYESPWLHWLCTYVGCIPVNRDGRDLAAIRAGLRALGEGRVLPIFPEGRIVPASGRDLGPMRPGGAYLAIRAGVPVVPAFIFGTPRTDEILESLVLPSRSRVVFGPPIDLSDIPAHRAGDKAVQAEVCARFERALRALQALAIAAEDGDAAIVRA